MTVVRSFLPSTCPCLARGTTSKLPRHQATTFQSQLRPHTFPYVLQTISTRPRNYLRRGQIIVEDGSRALPQVGSLASTTSHDARCCTFETTCTRTIRDTRLFCVNTQLLPILGAIKDPVRIANAGNWTHLPTCLRPAGKHPPKPRAPKPSHSPSVPGRVTSKPDDPPAAPSEQHPNDRSHRGTTSTHARVVVRHAHEMSSRAFWPQKRMHETVSPS